MDDPSGGIVVCAKCGTRFDAARYLMCPACGKAPPERKRHPSPAVDLDDDSDDGPPAEKPADKPAQLLQ